MKLSKVKKIIIIEVIIPFLFIVTFVFWQTMPNAPEPNNQSGSIIIGQDGTFTTSIEMNSINSPGTNERLVPEEFDKLINAPDGINWVYKMEFVFDISWVYDKSLGSILSGQLFEGTLLFTTDEQHNLICVDINERSSAITANDEKPVRVVVTISMKMPNNPEEYEDISGEVISIKFTAEVFPNDIANFDESLFIFTLIEENDNTVYELSWNRNNTKFIEKIIIPDTYKGRPVVIADDAFELVNQIENVIMLKGISRIGNSAFSRSSLKSMIILGNLDYIGNYALNATYAEVQIVGVLQTVGFMAFNTTSLVGGVIVDISETNTIGSYSFGQINAKNLTVRGGFGSEDIIIIEDNAFAYSQVVNLVIEGNKLQSASNGFTNIVDGANLTINANIDIMNGSFFGSVNFASITINGNVDKIENSTFGTVNNDKPLMFIINGNVEFIGSTAFINRTGFNVTISGYVNTIGDGNSFSGFKNGSITIGCLGRIVGTNTFMGMNNVAIYLMNKTKIPQLAADTFSGVTNLTIHVPKSLLDEFMAHPAITSNLEVNVRVI